MELLLDNTQKRLLCDDEAVSTKSTLKTEYEQS
jgi:hypothetical protein